MLHWLTPIHDEMEYQLGLLDELEEEEFPSQRERIRRMIYRSRARKRAMDDIIWMYPSYKALAEINKRYPVNMLPHVHPRRVKSLYATYDSETTVATRTQG